MSQSDKEQEKLKKQLEKLRKQPGNGKCANCASMSVPYVCLDFQTFVCTRCSALHRDFTHRVKSLTASKFKPEEVATFGGNEKDAAIYLKYWNEQLFKLPGAGNEDTQRARDFIQAKYVDKRWADESVRGPYPGQAHSGPPQGINQCFPAPTWGAPTSGAPAGSVPSVNIQQTGVPAGGFPGSVPGGIPGPISASGVPGVGAVPMQAGASTAGPSAVQAAPNAGQPGQSTGSAPNPFSAFGLTQPQPTQPAPAPPAQEQPVETAPPEQDPFGGLFDFQETPVVPAPPAAPAPAQAAQPVYHPPVAPAPSAPRFDPGAFVTAPKPAPTSSSAGNHFDDLFGQMLPAGQTGGHSTTHASAGVPGSAPSGPTGVGAPGAPGPTGATGAAWAPQAPAGGAAPAAPDYAALLDF